MDIKEYIIEEADKLFCQHGFRSVTMDDIAKQLGMSKKTIYQHFIDKDQLVNILIAQKLNGQCMHMEDLTHKSENAVHEVFLAVTNVNDLLSNIHARLFFDLQKYHPKAWQLFKNFRNERLRECICSNLNRGITEGLFREEIKPDILTQMRIDQIDITLQIHEEYTAHKYSLTEVTIEIALHFLYGMCNEKGRKMISKYQQQGLLTKTLNTN